jgi:hypothetical protein
MQRSRGYNKKAQAANAACAFLNRYNRSGRCKSLLPSTADKSGQTILSDRLLLFIPAIQSI